MYEFLMRLRPEFETVRAQLMHRVPPPPLSDILSLVIAEETCLRSLSDASSHPSHTATTGPHVVLAAPQFPQQFQPPSAPLLHSPGYSAPVRLVSAPRHNAPFTAPPAGGPRRPPVRCHYCQNLGHVKAECRKLQRA